MKLSDPDLYSLSQYLLGTCASVERGLESMDLDIEDYDELEIIEGLGEYVELCMGCDWWFESHELEATEFGELLCAQCNEE